MLLITTTALTNNEIHSDYMLLGFMLILVEIRFYFLASITAAITKHSQ